jgi:hypothetical protein
MKNDFGSSSRVGTRLVALATLSAFVGAVGYGIHQSFRAVTDSFVAPLILSPSNDLVLSNKLKVSELAVERVKASTQIASLTDDVEACTQAIERLEALRHQVSTALEWAMTVNVRQAHAGARELATLRKQRAMLADMTSSQQRLAADARANLERGLIGKADLAREVQVLNQMQLMVAENERTSIQSELSFAQVTLASSSLARRAGAATMPEMLMREDQMVRIDLELMKLQAERRAKAAEKTVLIEKLAKIEELEAQLKRRPIFRAIETNVDAAFVPYTQMNGVEPGAGVYDCVWGLVHCRRVGTVAELVPGEVVLPDPWGNQARGQYAVLDLDDHAAARSKTLRIRPVAGPSPSMGIGAPVLVSSR